jgi:DNA polymerase-3 subunit epsilon
MHPQSLGNDPAPHPTFVAIDFETADRGSDSACAVALVRVEGQAIVRREVRLLRPPRRRFVFTYVHGITWEDVAAAPTFAEAWPDLRNLLHGAAFLAAHNAPFDRGVLNACCRAAGLAPPDLPFQCTMEMARRTWRVYPTRLPDVCARLGLALKHHDPVSDAEACARIVLAAQEHAPAGQPAAGRRRRTTRGS